MDILLIRHGESEANARDIIQGRSDFPLSERGRRQARLTARALFDTPPELVFTSPLKRARATAEIVNERHRAPVDILVELNEYHLGGFEGLTMEEVVERWPDVPARIDAGEPFHLMAPGGERDEEVDVRAARAMKTILESGAGRVFVVAHLGIIERLLLLFAATRGDGVEIPRQVFPVANCSISEVRIDTSGLFLGRLNDTAHLEEDGE